MQAGPARPGPPHAARPASGGRLHSHACPHPLPASPQDGQPARPVCRQPGPGVPRCHQQQPVRCAAAAVAACTSSGVHTALPLLACLTDRPPVCVCAAGAWPASLAHHATASVLRAGLNRFDSLPPELAELPAAAAAPAPAGAAATNGQLPATELPLRELDLSHCNLTVRSCSGGMLCWAWHACLQALPPERLRCSAASCAALAIVFGRRHAGPVPSCPGLCTRRREPEPDGQWVGRPAARRPRHVPAAAAAAGWLQPPHRQAVWCRPAGNALLCCGVTEPIPLQAPSPPAGTKPMW